MKTWKRCRARENVQSMLSAEKRTIDVKREKTYKRCEARENLQSLPSTGKVTNVAKREKTWKRWQARDNMQSLPNAIKHGNIAKRRKTWDRCYGRESARKSSHQFAPDWWKTQHVCSDWLDHDVVISYRAFRMLSIIYRKNNLCRRRYIPPVTSVCEVVYKALF